MRNFIRTIFFLIFFSISSAVTTALLFPDLLCYYQDKQHLHSVKKSIQKLEQLNAKYDALLKNLRQDPDMLKRIAPAVLRAEPADPNAIYPDVTGEQIAAIKQALKKIEKDTLTTPATRQWLKRLTEPSRRVMLFFAGTALILIAFICFCPKKESASDNSN